MKLSIAIHGFLLDKQVAGASPYTIRNYKYDLRRFCEFLETDPEIGDVGPDLVKTFIRELMSVQYAPGGVAPRAPQRLSPKTIRNVYTTLSSLWSWALSEGYVETHIIRSIDAPEPEDPVIEPFTQGQIKALLDATQYSTPWSSSPDTQSEIPHLRQLRDRALILFLLDTGVRVSELCKLNVGDVDLRTGSAPVSGKGRMSMGEAKGRTVRVGQRARKAIWGYLAERNALDEADQPLFTTKEGTRIKTKALRTHLHRLGKRAKVEHCYPHRFRHTFAVNYLRNGGDIYTLQELLGHTSLEMVRRYLKLAQADVESAHRRASPVDNWNL